MSFLLSSLSKHLCSHSDPGILGFWAELAELKLEPQVVFWVTVWGSQRHLWCRKCSRSFLKWGSSSSLMGLGLLILGMEEMGCIPREWGSSVPTWDQSCAVDCLHGGNPAPVTLPGLNCCVNHCF